MEQILRDQVNNKLTNIQIANLSDIMSAGTALNTNTDRENANEQVFLNNLIKEISGINVLTFIPSPDWSYPNLIGLGQTNSCRRKRRSKRNIMT